MYTFMLYLILSGMQYYCVIILTYESLTISVQMTLILEYSITSNRPLKYIYVYTYISIIKNSGNMTLSNICELLNDWFPRSHGSLSDYIDKQK